MYARTYVFDEQKHTDDKAIEVTADTLYNTMTGYGYVTARNCRDTALLLPELNTGFLTDGDTPMPVCFRADVERSGNYEMNVQFYGRGEVLLFAGERRLVYRATCETQQQHTAHFVLNVCDIVPQGEQCLYEHRSVNLALVGTDARLSRLTLKKINCPTIYIAGDGTVSDHVAHCPYVETQTVGGWGQMLSYYLTGKIAVANLAHEGQTLERFRSEGHYAIVQANIRFGDYLLLAFAGKADAQGSDAVALYIEETLAVGAYPILAIHSAAQLGARYHIPVIDLTVSDGMNDDEAYRVAGEAVNAYRSLDLHNCAGAYTRLTCYMMDRDKLLYSIGG